MSDEAKRRAEIVGARPDVQRWIKRFRKLAKDMPPDVWVYCGNGAIIMAKDEHGHHIDDRGSVDRGAVIESVLDGSWDGGDF